MEAVNDESKKNPWRDRYAADRDSDWCGGVNLKQASELATHGWKDAPKLSGTDMSHALADYSVGQRQGTVASVSGAFLDVGAFCSGGPECFQEFTEVESPKGIVLGVNFGALCDVSPESMINQGLVMLAIADELQRLGFTVTLQAFWYSQGDDGCEFTLQVPVKRPGERVDENLLAYWACHPSALRQIGFAWQDIQDDTWHRKMDATSGRGRSLTPDSLEGIDYVFNNGERLNSKKTTFAYYDKHMAAIKKLLTKIT